VHPNPIEKVYLLTRSDLSPGLQAAQAAHAAFQFSVEHPELIRRWHDGSNYLILLSVPAEEDVTSWADEVRQAGVEHSLVWEPDVGGYTALAVGPSPFSARFSSLPLQGREVAVT
jgi:peptidyl-tRNA hydrolase